MKKWRNVNSIKKTAMTKK